MCVADARDRESDCQVVERTVSQLRCAVETIDAINVRLATPRVSLAGRLDLSLADCQESDGKKQRAGAPPKAGTEAARLLARDFNVFCEHRAPADLRTVHRWSGGASTLLWDKEWPGFNEPSTSRSETASRTHHLCVFDPRYLRPPVFMAKDRSDWRGWKHIVRISVVLDRHPRVL